MDTRGSTPATRQGRRHRTRHFPGITIVVFAMPWISGYNPVQPTRTHSGPSYQGRWEGDYSKAVHSPGSTHALRMRHCNAPPPPATPVHIPADAHTFCFSLHISQAFCFSVRGSQAVCLSLALCLILVLPSTLERNAHEQSLIGQYQHSRNVPIQLMRRHVLALERQALEPAHTHYHGLRRVNDS